MAARADSFINETLRAFHKLGSAVQAKGENGRVPYGSGDKLIEKLGHKLSYLSQARKFANLYPTGTRLDWICRLGQDRGKPLGPSHVNQLLSVADKGARDELAKRCAAKGWSVVRLRNELAQRRPKKPYGGRPLEAAATSRLAQIELQFMAERWLRWLKANEKSAVHQLPEAVQKALGGVRVRLDELSRALQAATKLPVRGKSSRAAQRSPKSSQRRSRRLAKPR